MRVNDAAEIRHFCGHGWPYSGRRKRRRLAAKENPMKTHADLLFALPLDSPVEARAMLLECVSRVFVWIADAHVSTVLLCVRPDLVAEPTLEAFGEHSGRSFQVIHRLARIFA